MLWLHVEAADARGRTFHLPVDRKGFGDEDLTIASDLLAYQDIGDIKGMRRHTPVSSGTGPTQR